MFRTISDMESDELQPGYTRLAGALLVDALRELRRSDTTAALLALDWLWYTPLPLLILSVIGLDVAETAYLRMVADGKNIGSIGRRR